MRIGITGHQSRPNIDWGWVRSAIKNELDRHSGRHVGYSSLAVGADQIFAQVLLERGDQLVAVLPLKNYEKSFQNGLDEYRRLKSLSTVKELSGDPTFPEQAYLAAGQYVVDQTELLVAVWDGERSRGAGGTEDVVRYAKSSHRRVFHIEPMSKTVRDI